MGAGVNIGKQTTFHCSQCLIREDFPLICSWLPRCSIGCISGCHIKSSCFLLSVICFLQGRENWKAVLSGSRGWTCKPASTPSPQWHPGGGAGRLQTEPAAFIFLSPKQSTIPEPSSLITSPSHGASKHLTVHTHHDLSMSHQPSYSKTFNVLQPKRKQGSLMKFQHLFLFWNRPQEVTMEAQPTCVCRWPRSYHQGHPPALPMDWF